MPVRHALRRLPGLQATISHHLRELVQAGLVDYQREGQFVHITARRDILDAYAAELVRRVSRGSGQGVRFEKPKTAKGA